MTTNTLNTSNLTASAVQLLSDYSDDAAERAMLIARARGMARQADSDTVTAEHMRLAIGAPRLTLSMPEKPESQWEAGRVALAPKADCIEIPGKGRRPLLTEDPERLERLRAGITVTAHDRCEWLRFAKAAYSACRRDIGNRFASVRAGDRLTCAEYDDLQAEYRAWLIHGTIA